MTDYLPVGVRGHAVRRPENVQRGPGKTSKGAMRRPAALPRYLLVLDTETTTVDLSQRLNFGAYRYYRLHWGAEQPYERVLSMWEASPPYMILLQEGLVYADDLARRDPNGIRCLRRYARSHRAAVDREHTWSGFEGLRLLSRRQFEKHVLHPAAAETRAVIAAYNFPFDISRLAVGYSACRTGSCAGGFAFDLAEYEKDGAVAVNDYHKRWSILHIDSKKAIKMLLPGRDDENGYAGNLLDLRTLVHGLTAVGHTLESACEAFRVPYEKRDVEHGKITARYIDYCREDVDATARLWRAAMIEYSTHPIARPPERIYSSASLGKGYVEALGITPLSERGISDEVNGYASVAYYGGRAECRIRRPPVPVPVQPRDFKSNYPTDCSLLDLWPLITAERIQTIEEEPAKVSRRLENLDLDDCFDPALWPSLRAIALVEPDGDILPVRARYSDHGSTWGIGLNVFSSSEPLWYTLPDLVGSGLFTHKAPKILRVLRFEPHGQLESLAALRLRGEVLVNPRKRDLFRACVEARTVRKRELKRLVAEGAITREQADADPLAYFLKILVNATSYGIFAEINRLESAGKEIVDVHALSTIESETPAPEEAGRFYCAPIAALITGGARLMLAMLERCVTDLGGTYLATDTDSMAIVASQAGGLVPCPGGPYRTNGGREAVRALSWADVNGISGRFASLNPYKRSIVPGSILEPEDESFDPDTGEQLELMGYAISAKRYCYYTLDEDGDVEIRKVSEHGLGQYLDPTDPEKREPRGQKAWVRDVWEWIVRTDALGQEASEPDGLDRPALRQHPISTPRLLRPLEALNAGLDYGEQVKPFGFMTIATPISRRVIPSGPFALVQPYSSDPRDWADQPWINVHDGPGGPRYRIGYIDDPTRAPWVTVNKDGSYGDDEDDGARLFPGASRLRKGETLLPVKRFRDVLHDFVWHREYKSAAPDGSPCRPGTRGLLQHRTIALGTLTYLGKESNLLEESLAGLHVDADEIQTEYLVRSLPSRWTLVLEILRGIPVSRVAKATGLDRGTVAAVLNGTPPRASTRMALERLALDHATSVLTARGIRPPARPESRLALLLRECGLAVCPECGGRLPSGRATYCSATCRKRASRSSTAA